MGKKLQVLVVFEFDGIDDPDSVEAEIAIDTLSQLANLDQTYEDTGASAIWVQDATITQET
jgi:hypothetical protein